MHATLIFRRRELLPGGIVVDMTIWKLPAASADRPHGLKYRLQAHRRGKTIVRYDNETGKGDHRHLGRREFAYHFVSMEKLVEDFIEDVERLGGRHVQ